MSLQTCDICRIAGSKSTGAGPLFHALPKGSTVALCGQKSGPRSVWSTYLGKVVTCPRCIKELDCDFCSTRKAVTAFSLPDGRVYYCCPECTETARIPLTANKRTNGRTAKTMTNEKQTVTMPLGVLAGQAVALPDAINHLASEILGHGADLETIAEKASLRPADYPQTAETYTARAEDLRRYGWALWLIGQQAQDTRPPESEAEKAHLASLAELYKLTPPPGWAKP